jgi:transposase
METRPGQPLVASAHFRIPTGGPPAPGPARQPVRLPDQRPGLGRGPRRQLRGRPGRPGPLALTPPGLPGRGLSPAEYESAGRRRDGAISREGSVTLRRALIDLGIGLWRCDPPARAYAAALRARGKHGGIIACALAHRAGRIAFALVRTQAPYDPARWETTAH